jgi:hypothetical protein
MVGSAAMTNVRRIYHHFEEKKKEERKKMKEEKKQEATQEQHRDSFFHFFEVSSNQSKIIDAASEILSKFLKISYFSATIYSNGYFLATYTSPGARETGCLTTSTHV